MANRKPRDLLVRFLADVNPFLRDTRQVEDAFRDVSRSTDDLERQGSRNADDLARAYQRAGDKIERESRTTGRAAREEFGSTGREAGQEFANNLGQSLSSGDTTRIVQDSVGGLIGSLALAGPIGVAAAAAGTIGLSFWNAFADKAATQKQAVLDAAESVYQGLLDQGADFVKQFQQDTLKEFFDPNSQNDLAKGAKEASDALHDNLGEALAGGPESIAAYADKARKKIDELIARSKARGQTGGQQQFLDLAKQYQKELDYLDSIQQGWHLATTRFDQYRAAVSSPLRIAYGPGSATYRSQVPNAARNSPQLYRRGRN